MKIHKRLTALLLSILAVLMLLPMQAFAAGRIDLTRDVSLTISYQDGKTPLTDAQFDLYLVATVDSSGELTATEPFAQYNVNIRGKNDEAWKALASTLEGFVLRDQVSPTDSGKTDKQGLLSFPNQQKSLAQGLYLVLGQLHTQGGFRYDASPFMVMLPGLDEESNDWDYALTANVKYDSSKIPEGPDTVTRKVLKVWEDGGHEAERPKEITVQLLRNGKVYDTVTLNAANNWRYTWNSLDAASKWTVVEKELDDYTVTVTQEGVTFVVTNTYDTPGVSTPTNPTNPDQPAGSNPSTSTTLPQTGQLWWPVPLLIAAGLLLIVIGLLRRKGAGYEK